MSEEIVTTENGPRPAGKSDECFYCGEKVGAVHSDHCIIPRRFVVIREIIERVVSVPKSWEPYDIDFQRNDGSWCADNIVDELRTLVDAAPDNTCSLCPMYEAEYVREATPEDLERNRISASKEKRT